MEKVRRVVQGPRVGLALSGGGCKAFFGLGVGKVLLEAGIPITAISGTSAGSAMALSLVSGVADSVVSYFYAVTYRNRSNFYWSRLLRGKRPFPHERMYRRTIATYTDYEVVRKSHIKVAINTLLVPPERFPLDQPLRRFRLLAEVGQAFRDELKNAEKGIFKPLMPGVAMRAGLEEVIFRNEDFTSNRKAEDIILAASSAPPLVAFQRMDDGNYYLDGGITNNLPVTQLGEQDIVIAVYYEEMTRRFFELSGGEDGRTIVYIRPDTHLPITTWDYANPTGVRQAYEMGRRAGEKALPLLSKILAE
ncbi:MAG: patatin-like phospholipase family protein [Spirochaetia bacterium]|nr:patatin-like phospholipase family protein [Spirochaetia bacterium]